MYLHVTVFGNTLKVELLGYIGVGNISAMAKRIISNFKFTATNKNGLHCRKEIQTLTNSSIEMKKAKVLINLPTSRYFGSAAAQADLTTEFCMVRRLIDK